MVSGNALMEGTLLLLATSCFLPGHAEQGRSAYGIGMRSLFPASKANALNDFKSLMIKLRCLPEASPCNPWNRHCCEGFECMNLEGGFCMREMEPCVCQRNQEHTSRFRSPEWYRKKRTTAR